MAEVTLCARIIARLDIKPSLGAVKGVRLDGLKRIGPAGELAVEYEDQGADEILMLDTTASLYGRLPAWEYLTSTSHALMIPLTYGGGIRSVEDFRYALRVGADKVALNTAVVGKPWLLTECAHIFGAQAVVLQLDAKRWGQGWRVYTHGGREPSGRDAIEWAQEAVTMGAGEILLTSVDRDGTMLGYDEDLVRAVCEAVTVPVIASGGAGSPADVGRILEMGVSPAVGTWLHAGGTIGELKAAAASHGVEVR